MHMFELSDYLSKQGAQERSSADCPAFTLLHEKFLETIETLKTEGGYELLVDLTAVDWGLEAAVRFTVVYHFYSLRTHTYLRIAVDCPSNTAPELPSLVGLYPAANWHERETFDMFGIVFVGHPNLKRILMWEGYPYHPLRKDFPLAGIEAPLPSFETAEATGQQLIAAPMAGGPFHAQAGKAMSEREPMGADQSWNEDFPKPKISEKFPS